MNNQIILSSIISIVYLIFKFLEMRFLLKENKPLKSIVIDALIVFISSTLGLIILDQFNLNEIMSDIKQSPSAFVSAPDF